MSIGLKLLQGHSPRVIMYGMSCVGKTTFAQLMTDHQYFCFDALFDWYTIETLGLSIDANLQRASDLCNAAAKFVLDGWNLGDKEGQFFPSGTTAYVVYDDYDSIIDRYRVEVTNRQQHLPMFNKWYDLELRKPARYFKNHGGDIEETGIDEFIKTKELFC